mmetsp:Transcript_14279/g.34003  ORF Transcript_14279/g.34003 Transcript_14279/m.34003 type:complete len:225 (+) Transcript_14279:190-864(+)
MAGREKSQWHQHCQQRHPLSPLLHPLPAHPLQSCLHPPEAVPLVHTKGHMSTPHQRETGREGESRSQCGDHRAAAEWRGGHQQMAGVSGVYAEFCCGVGDATAAQWRWRWRCDWSVGVHRCVGLGGPVCGGDGVATASGLQADCLGLRAIARGQAAFPAAPSRRHGLALVVGRGRPAVLPSPWKARQEMAVCECDPRRSSPEGSSSAAADMRQRHPYQRTRRRK